PPRRGQDPGAARQHHAQPHEKVGHYSRLPPNPVAPPPAVAPAPAVGGVAPRARISRTIVSRARSNGSARIHSPRGDRHADSLTPSQPQRSNLEGVLHAPAHSD